MRITLKNVRISYARLFKPRAFSPGDPEKYSTSVIIDKEDKENIKLLQDAIKAVKEELGSKVKPKVTCWRDGDTDPSASEVTKGAVFFNASSADKPIVVSRTRKPLTSEEIWSGCYCNVNIGIFSTTKGGLKICAALNAVQLVQEGDRLDGKQSVEQMFDMLDDDEIDDSADFFTVD